MNMSDILRKSELALWQNYCDKKIECDRLTEENAKLREMLLGVTNEYEELLEKSISHIGSHGTSALSQAKQLLNKLKDQTNDNMA